MTIRLHRQLGFTLFEVLITIGVAGVIGLVAYQFVFRGFDTWRLSAARAQSQDAVRRAVDSMSALIRESRPGDNGAYPVAVAQAATLTFYANVDADVAIEQVQWSLSGTNLQRRVIEPTGQPAQYTGSGTTTTIVRNVRTLAFDYFDENYSGTQLPLTQPVTVSNIRLVRMTVSVDDDVVKAPAAVTMSIFVSLRNLKDNL